MSTRSVFPSAISMALRTVWPFALSILILLASMMASLEIMSSVRAFVGAESIWSKHQKQSHITLETYIHTHDDKDFAAFRAALDALLAYRDARREMDSNTPDLDVAYAGLVNGGTDPEDAPSFVRIYQGFRHTPLLTEASRIWAETDPILTRLGALGESIRQQIVSGHWSATEQDRYLLALRQINDTLTPMEFAFSKAVAQSSRQGHRLLIASLAGLTVLLMGAGFFLSQRLTRQHIAAVDSQRKQAELSRAILRGAGDGIHIVDDKGCIVEVSDSFCSLLGYTREEVIGMHVMSFEAQHTPEEVAVLMQRISEGEGGRLIVSKHRHKDGSLIDIELNVRPMEMEGRRFIFAATRDIRERLRTQSELQRSRSLLQTVIDHIPMRVFWKDASLRYLGCNPAFAHDTGKSSPEELIGKDDHAMSWTDQAEAYRADDQAILDTGVAKLGYEEPQTQADGRTYWMRTSKVPLKDPDGQVIGVLGLYEDITEAKALRDELERHRVHLEELVKERTEALKRANRDISSTQYAMDRVGIGITWVDFDSGRFTYCNQTAAELLEYTREELLELTVPDIDPNFPASRFAEVKQEIRARKHLRFETEQKTKSGRLIPTEVSIYYLGGVGVDRTRRFIAFQTDISDRKQAERDLLDAKNAAEVANRSKSEFLANMSHEIRTPMNGVIGMSEMLLNTPLDEQQLKMARVIHDSARSQLGILNDILDFSKIEAGKLELSIEPFAMNVVLRRTLSNLNSHASQKGVTVRTTFDPTIPPALMGDSLRLRQVLINFASNAIKFSSGLERPGEVNIEAYRIDGKDDRIWIELSVRDNGIGMDDETLQRVFHPFVQADASTTRRYGGTGLGLVISMRLIEAMGGEIHAESAPNKGSTFSARLPFEEADPSQLITESEPNPPAPVSGVMPDREEAVRQGRLILVAEDNDTNQAVIEQQLATLGYACDLAADGQEALNRWAGGDYALVISDIHMPRMDGYQLAQAIREAEKQHARGRTPLIALTANVMKGEAERCQAAGMDGYLAKPVPLSELSGQLTRWLPSGGAHRAPEETPQTAGDPGPGGGPGNGPENGPGNGPDAGPPIYDPGALSQMVGDNPAIHARLLRKFVDNARERAADLHSAHAATDLAMLALTAHSLKSAARSVGALRLGERCEALEKAGKAEDEQRVAALFADFPGILDTALAAIDQRLAEIDGKPT
ncbi:MAG: PAS domain S-box protein [Gammaproteobacteria bacterium]